MKSLVDERREKQHDWRATKRMETLMTTFAGFPRLGLMTAPAVFWPTLLGLSFLAAGIITYRSELRAPTSLRTFGLVALGPMLVAASLAAFAGEHFTAAASLAGLVPKWLPARLFIAYFVGVAHLAAASSFVARRYIRWSAFFLAVMFALFVLLMDLPAAVAHPTNRIFWILAARETTFAIGALALCGSATTERWPQAATRLAAIARIWIASVLVFYGIEHVLHPEYTPGVPSSALTAAWLPLPLGVAYATGILLIGCGIAMLGGRYASSAAALCGTLMVALTLALYVPQFFLARNTSQQVTAINFVFDTLLFAGMMFAISGVIANTDSQVSARSREASVFAT